jgi:gamma-glutamyltranspeptidase / glutathione hydrolase
LLPAQPSPYPGVPRHTRQAGSVGRSVVHARHGMVATSEPLAAQAGLAVLQRGGNAIDAALAMNAMLGVVEPMSCGIGGDLFAMIWDARTGTLHGLNASGAAPARATLEAMASRGLAAMPEYGPLTWTVPGCVDGWQALQARFGSWPLSRVLEPAIATAEEGFPVAEVIAGMWEGAAPRLLATPEATRTFLPDGRAPRAGEIFRNPALAQTYRALARDGRDAFYRGPVASALAAFSHEQGGLLDEGDLAANAPRWVAPLSTTYRGVEIWELPPPGQGLAVLQMLGILEGSDLARLGPLSPDYWHLFVEAKKLAFADRARFYADPDFADVPTAALLSRAYAQEQRGRIHPGRAAALVPPGGASFARLSGDTIYLAAVDEQRNAVSLIQSNFRHFGSALVPTGLGFALQNRGSSFSLDPRHANRLEPRKRPFHTIIPALATRGGKPWLVFGVMGADMQPQGQVQVLVNLLDFGMNVQAAGEAPRIEHVGSASPSGAPEAPDGGTVIAEEGIPEAVVAELARRGHQVSRTQRNGGGYQGILIDRSSGALLGGSESRSDGCAAGY